MRWRDCYWRGRCPMYEIQLARLQGQPVEVGYELIADFSRVRRGFPK